MTRDEDKGQWAETAEEGIVPDALSGDDDAGPTGKVTGDDTPATAEGVDLSAGDNADATTDGGPPEPPEGVEPDLKDAP